MERQVIWICYHCKRVQNTAGTSLRGQPCCTKCFHEQTKAPDVTGPGFAAAVVAIMVLCGAMGFVVGSFNDTDVTRFRNEAVQTGHAEWISDPRDGHPVFHWKELEK